MGATALMVRLGCAAWAGRGFWPALGMSVDRPMGRPLEVAVGAPSPGCSADRFTDTFGCDAMGRWTEGGSTLIDRPSPVRSLFGCVVTAVPGVEATVRLGEIPTPRNEAGLS